MVSELVYRGHGSRPSGPATSWDGDPNDPDSPTAYVADEGLADAVNAAILLKQPLLVMGEPGTGKTQLARSVAWELRLPLHTFNTKMNSAGYDLFYHYDSLLHFHDTQILKTQHRPSKYIRYAALGKAILFSNPPSVVNSYLAEGLAQVHTQPTRSVVLIDEIDKAPRDFPNDILAETERLEFLVRETDWTISANRDLFPILIFTSNQERNLPEAFLRRCIFYYIPFPDEAQLRNIVQRRLTGEHDAAIRKFLEIRSDDQLVKKPATAELISWLRLLAANRITGAEIVSGSERARRSLSVLLKNKEDLERYTRGERSGASAATQLR